MIRTPKLDFNEETIRWSIDQPPFLPFAAANLKEPEEGGASNTRTRNRKRRFVCVLKKRKRERK